MVRNLKTYKMTLLSAPNICGNEWKYVKECLDTGWVSSVGSFVNKFEEDLAKFTGAKYAVATSSGTTALHISLLLAGVQRGDFVIVPNVTFIASLNSIVYTGASPILIDVDKHNWQMDLNILEQYLSEHTFQNDKGECIESKSKRVIRAIMPVHVLGNICDLSRLEAIAKKYQIVIVEDSTEALGSFYKEKHAGTIGLLGTVSFNGNKIITTGGGGMILTNDEILAKKAKHLTTQAKADAFEYYHDEIGYNYRLVNVLAAIGVAQLELLPEFLKRKKEVADFYRSKLDGVGDISFATTEEGVIQNEWLFTIRTAHQKKLLNVLNEQKLQSRPFWVPMNDLPMFKDEIYVQNDNISEQLYSSCLSIPCSTQISNEEVEKVVSVIQNNF